MEKYGVINVSKKYMNWLKYSGVWITLVINPHHWKLFVNKEVIEPNGVQLTVQLLFVTLHIVIDNGDW